MRRIDLLFNEYGESHQNATNKAIHWICVPLIFFSLVCLLWSIPADQLNYMYTEEVNPFINWATIILGVILLYYIILSIPLFIGMLFFSVLCVLGAYYLDQVEFLPLWAIALIIFVLAWIGQFYGHKVEGKKPSFLKDIQFLLIGPAWLMHFVFKKLGIQY